MYTANTMSSAIEAMGMSLPGSSSNPAVSADKLADCEAAGASCLQFDGKRHLSKRYYDKRSI